MTWRVITTCPSSVCACVFDVNVCDNYNYIKNLHRFDEQTYNFRLHCAYERWGQKVKPVLQALIVAERVYRLSDGRCLIAGTFSSVTITNDPEHFARKVEDEDGQEYIALKGAEPGSPWVYLSLTDVRRNTVLELQFVSLSRNVVIIEQKINIDCTNPLATVELVIPLPRLPIPEPGTYAFEVVCEDEIIGSHRIRAVMSEDQPGE